MKVDASRENIMRRRLRQPLRDAAERRWASVVLTRPRSIWVWSYPCDEM